MGWYLDGRTGIAKKGEIVFVPAGAKHTYWLEGEEDSSVLITLFSNVSLPIGFADESFFEVFALLLLIIQNFYSNERDQNYKTNVIEKLYLLYANGMHIGDLPYWVNEVLSSVLHVVAPLLGFKKHYPEYTVNYDLIYHQNAV
jgi:hypothetical protein